MTGPAAVFVLLLFLSGCQAKSMLLRPANGAANGGGKVFVYAQPFQQEADRLVFSLEDISALRDDGAVFQLSPVISEFRGRDMKSQRLIASGSLPPGHYAGLSFRVRSASLEVEGGGAKLLVPDGPVRTDFAFDLSKERSYVILLKFNYPGSISERLSFSPVFTAFFPDRPVVDLTAYVVNHDSDNITVIDKAAMQVTGVISTGKGPGGVAFEHDLKRAYVTLSGDDSVEVIDIASGEVMNRIRLNAGDSPKSPVLTPDGKVLLTANQGSGTVSIIDPAAFIESDRINVGNGPNSVLIDRAGRRAYVFNTLSGSITVIDIASRSAAAVISTEPGPLSGQFNRAGDRLYVIHEWSSYLTVIDPYSVSVLGRTRIGIGAKALKLDTRTGLVYIGKKAEALVEVYDPLSFVQVYNITAERGPSYITIDDEGNNLYLVVPERKALYIIDL
ncbi:MAG: hypothetical protein OEU95_07920, partial [Nitrospirota bacterium]|nr:hypothetical protein [Nitrospirota bacterium]